MSRATLSLDRLPTEILTRILKPLLQHTGEQIDSWNRGVTTPKNTSYAQVWYAPRQGEELQPQLLRVCKRFNEIGTDLLYESHFIFVAWVVTYYYDEEAAETLRKFMKKFSQPRDERHRMKKLCLIIYTPDFYQFGQRDTDGEWLDELFAGLALHQPCWEEVDVNLFDLTPPARYNTSRMESARLLYGLGRLHAKDVSDLGDKDLAWCLGSAQHRYPLLLLHGYLGAYFDAWTPRAQAESQIPLRREELMTQALQAAKSHDEEGFSTVMLEAVDHVEAVYRQYLNDYFGAPENSMEAPLPVDHEASEDEPYQRALKECQEQGRQLMSARDRKWRASYRPKRVDLPERQR